MTLVRYASMFRLLTLVCLPMYVCGRVCVCLQAATRDAVTVWCAVVEGSLLGRDWATDEEGEEGARVAPYAAVAIHNDAM